ncbi:response regulator transcription factor [Hymenobacter saemangeumensis]|uniref:Response regulator transcription factor n=1 Tax=Hymenobacter saemangeumensis TaxID=1084522 RepID=A0ABP8I5P2_9BACT
MNLATPRILVAAAPTLQRHGLLATLQELRPNLFLSATADAYTLPARLRREAPSLLILDANLPGPPLSTLVEQVRQAQPRQRLLVLGGRRLPLSLRRHLVDMGAGALLAKQATPEEVVAAVEQLLASSSCVQFQCNPVQPSGSSSSLSSRELEILQLVGQDYSTSEIAAQLFISVRTVDAHRRTLLQKTGTRSSVGLVLHAVKRGWLELG